MDLKVNGDFIRTLGVLVSVIFWTFALDFALRFLTE